MTQDAPTLDASGLAALGICESLLLALTDLRILKEEDVRDLLNDVESAHSEAATNALSPERNRAVVDIMQRILAGKNGIRS